MMASTCGQTARSIGGSEQARRGADLAAAAAAAALFCEAASTSRLWIQM